MLFAPLAGNAALPSGYGLKDWKEWSGTPIVNEPRDAPVPASRTCAAMELPEPYETIGQFLTDTRTSGHSGGAYFRGKIATRSAVRPSTWMNCPPTAITCGVVSIVQTPM